jgi:hypothetical protein
VASEIGAVVLALTTTDPESVLKPAPLTILTLSAAAEAAPQRAAHAKSSTSPKASRPRTTQPGLAECRRFPTEGIVCLSAGRTNHDVSSLSNSR